MSTIKDIVANFALGRYKRMCTEELLDTLDSLVHIVDEDTPEEERIALKKPYWSLVYRIAGKSGLMWDMAKVKDKKNTKKNKEETKDKKDEESKPKKEKSN